MLYEATVLKYNQEVIEKVVGLENADNVRYLPHQAIVRREATTTKVRIVYGAFSKGTKSSTSLNDCPACGTLPKFLVVLQPAAVSRE